MEPIVKTVTRISDIPPEVPLKDILLPREWTLYLYKRQDFRKLVDGQKCQVHPHRALMSIKTVNDVAYLLELLKSKNTLKQDGTTNLDANDYVFMRSGIEPIWEDKENKNGGTLAVRVPYADGYNIWTIFVTRLVSEDLGTDVDNINGITVSYIPNKYNDSKGKNSMYFKVWDRKPGRNKDSFLSILSQDILDMIGSHNPLYSANREKKHYNDEVKDKLDALHEGRRKRRGKK